MFNKILIANRGAIAVRIERSLHQMGIESVAVYTRADQDSLHVENATEAVLIGDGPAKESYLNAQLIIDVAKKTGAQAIHPGYGFLSENASFARACEENGICFIGPTVEQLELFGLKHSARKLAKKANIPLLPGTNLIQDFAEAETAALHIGYPVILKSTAGGGGVGMRVCADVQELHDAFDAVRDLSEKNFKNSGVYVEKYIEHARHVEVQFFGNQHGEVAIIGDRDCSIQRRNQKIIEECPAPDLPDQVRYNMQGDVKRLALQIGYRSAGTVEFLYNVKSGHYYFLEVNTRLQVEHGITEEVYGLDLVEWMVREAADEIHDLAQLVPEPKGHSMQMRIYAEDCFRDFMPAIGRVDKIEFPQQARVETWIRNGLQLSTFYDSLLAKVIVHASSRKACIEQLSQALRGTKVYGVTTNIHYVLQLLQTEQFTKANIYTQMIQQFDPSEQALEVVDAGVQTTVQDWPGRTGYWDVGVPPCGPMDSLSFRIGNKLLGNDDSVAGLELTFRGGSYKFRADMWVCITGANMNATLDDAPVNMFRPILVKRGQVLHFGEAEKGMRTYLLVAGGLDLPQVLGSSSTFTLGGFGGHGGRSLKVGDVLYVHDTGDHDELAAVYTLSSTLRPSIERKWLIRATPGPHCTQDYLQPEYLKNLTDSTWEVHYNSSRTGVRLMGPKPSWSRADGGDAGLHPSNIHDNAYAIGTLNLTGDVPILLGPDGPSLGGFVCPITTIGPDLWKIGQLQPGDSVRFQLVSLEEAINLRIEQETELQAIRQDAWTLSGRKSIMAADNDSGSNHEHLIDTNTNQCINTAPNLSEPYKSENVILARVESVDKFPVCIRSSGDANVLVEIGSMELNMLHRFQVHMLMEAIKDSGEIPVLDLTPGVRSLQIHFDPMQISAGHVCAQVLQLHKQLPPLESVEVPSRIIRLPLSWDDPSTQLATERYEQNIRSDAPWCPDNIEFIRRINGLDSVKDVHKIVFEANYVVLGLGDVYLGAPLATPMDPRHRLVTTKYNPARTWTPESAVGIGGAYLCVYGMESPGGYQLVGRTLPVWNGQRSTPHFESGKPWLLRFFDQIQFYPVAASELPELRDKFIRGKLDIDLRETTFKLDEYVQFQESIKESTKQFRHKQLQAFIAERERWKEQGITEHVIQEEPLETMENSLPAGTTEVRCHMPGSVWKVFVTPGQEVHAGDTLIIEESMKLEFSQHAPINGYVHAVYVQPGDELLTGQLIVALTENNE